VNDPTTLRVHPGADGVFTLYDDDGQSLGYLNDSDEKTIWIHFRWEDATRHLIVERDARMNKWTGGVRRFAVETAGSKAAPKVIEFRGNPVAVNL
jgi:hypothetical protein